MRGADYFYVSALTWFMFVGFLALICTLSDYDSTPIVHTHRIEKKNQSGVYVGIPSKGEDGNIYIEEFPIVVENFEYYGYTCLIDNTPLNVSKLVVLQELSVQYTKILKKRNIVFAGCKDYIVTIPTGIFSRILLFVLFLCILVAISGILFTICFSITYILENSNEIWKGQDSRPRPDLKHNLEHNLEHKLKNDLDDKV